MIRIPTFALLAAVTAAALAVPDMAQAHSGLARAKPAAGSIVSPAPKEVVLSFTETIEPRFSSIEVRDAKGAAMQAGPASVDHARRTELRVPLKALAPGTYKVIWRVLSVDTHRSQGTFTFRVRP